MKRYRAIVVGMALVGCSAGEGAVPLEEVSHDSLPPLVERQPSVLVAVPERGGRPRYFNSASLEELLDVYTPSLPPLEEVWGIDVGTGTLVGVTDDREAISINLDTGRRIAFARGVVGGSLSPTGMSAAVTDEGSVATFRRRTRRDYAQPIAEGASTARARHDGRIVVIRAGDSTTLALLGRDDDTRTQTVAGSVVLAPYADRALVFGDSSVILVDPSGRSPADTVRLAAAPRSAAFSPSGHLVYVLTHEPALRVINRYPTHLGASYAVGRPLEGIRIDPLGQWLLLHVEDQDSALVLQAAPVRSHTTLASEWSAEFPLMTPEGIVLTRIGNVITALELGTFDTLATMTAAPRTHWLVTTRIPSQDLGRQEDPRTDFMTTDTTITTQFFVQIASSQNEVWAGDLANTLVRDANLPARVLAPVVFGEGYRVVIGPYASREEADHTGTSLSRPFWIYVREPSDSIR